MPLPYSRDSSPGDPAPVGQYSDYWHNLRVGNIPNLSLFSKFGRNPSASGASDVWAGSGIYTGQPRTGSPETVTITSSSAADVNTSGTGAWTVEFTGLKTATSTAYETETVNLNGQNLVTSANTWWRVNRAIVTSAGTGQANAGVITIAHTTTTTNIFVKIAANLNQSTVAAWTVPYGTTAYLENLYVGGTRTSGSGYSTVSLRVRETGGVYAAKHVYTITDAIAPSLDVRGATMMGSGADIVWRIDSISAGAFDVSASFTLTLET